MFKSQRGAEYLNDVNCDIKANLSNVSDGKKAQQIIMDVGGRKGDYTRICKHSKREEYLSNCPDPNGILRMNQYISN